MKVSVVVCTYAADLYEHLVEAVESVRTQTYDSVEIVVVVDGNDRLCERVTDKYGTAADVLVHCNEGNVGLSQSRNNALEHASGDVIAFLDDDAVADERWIEELVGVYKSEDAIAAGGRMTPIWVDGRPEFLPEEFHWLVGVTYPGFAEAGEEVRNTFGSNISFRADVLRDLGGFDSEVGRKGELNLQAEEPLLGARMRERYDRGVVYTPDAEVGHKVFDYRTDPAWLLKRAFWQGYSKRAMETLVDGESSGEESAFLGRLVFMSIPRRMRSFVRTPSFEKISQLVMLVVLTVAVGLGYLYASIER